jgi:hypothetical protein
VPGARIQAGRKGEDVRFGPSLALPYLEKAVLHQPVPVLAQDIRRNPGVTPGDGRLKRRPRGGLRLQECLNGVELGYLPVQTLN